MKNWRTWKWVVAIKLFFATRKAAKQKVSDAKVLKKWLGDETNKQETARIATIFNQFFRGGWFTLSQVQQNTNYKTIPEAMRILNLLKLSGCLVAEMRGERELYKIVFGPEQKKAVLTTKKKKLEVELENVKGELKELEKDQK